MKVVRLYHLLAMPIALVSVFSLPLLAQSRGTIQIISQPAITKVGSQHWASGGAGITEEGLASAPMTNPALLDPRALTLTLEAGRRLRTTWILDIDYDGQFILPTYGAVLISFDDFAVAVGFSSFLNERFLFGQIPVTTESSPEVPAGYIEPKYSGTVNFAFGTVSASIIDGWRMGLTIGAGFSSYKEELGTSSLRATGVSPVFVFGLAGPIGSTVRLGTTVRHTFETSLKTDFQSTLFRSAPSTRPTQRYPTPPQYVARFPLTIEAGVGWNPLEDSWVHASFEYLRWSRVDSGMEDVVAFHVGSVIPLSQSFSCRIGFFTQPEADPNFPRDQNFLTAGFDWSWSEDLLLSAAASDSHLLSNSKQTAFSSLMSEPFRQTHFSASITWSL